MRRFLVCVVLVGLVGCGYHFLRVGEGLPMGVDTVFAPVVINRTGESALETTVTEALRLLLIREGVMGASDCPVRLQGELINVMTGPQLVRAVAPDSGVVISTSNIPVYASFRVTATLRLTLTRHNEILGKTEVTANEDYLPDATNDTLNLEAARQQALTRLSDVLVRDAYERLTARQ